jgi:hypothetical protein
MASGGNDDTVHSFPSMIIEPRVCLLSRNCVSWSVYALHSPPQRGHLLRTLSKKSLPHMRQREIIPAICLGFDVMEFLFVGEEN